YRDRVMTANNITKEEFFQHLKETVRTDPKNLAKYIDANNTLMFLSLFDHSVPLKYGLKLRKEIGSPQTVFLVSGHYTTLLYTQFVKLALPVEPLCIFPMDYVEAESLAFFRKSFGEDDISLHHVFYSLFQVPIKIVAKVADWLS